MPAQTEKVQNHPSLSELFARQRICRLVSLSLFLVLFLQRHVGRVVASVRNTQVNPLDTPSSHYNR